MNSVIGHVRLISQHEKPGLDQLATKLLHKDNVRLDSWMSNGNIAKEGSSASSGIRVGEFDQEVNSPTSDEAAVFGDQGADAVQNDISGGGVELVIRSCVSFLNLLRNSSGFRRVGFRKQIVASVCIIFV